MEFQFSGEALVAICAGLVSLVFGYFPVVRVKFAALASETKSVIMLGMLLIVTAVVFGLTCGGILKSGLSCDKAGLLQAVWYYLIAIMSNQSIYSIFPETADVRSAKVLRES